MLFYNLCNFLKEDFRLKIEKNSMINQDQNFRVMLLDIHKTVFSIFVFQNYYLYVNNH